MKYIVSFSPDGRWNYRRAFESAGMAFESIVGIARECPYIRTEIDLADGETVDALLRDLLELSSENDVRWHCIVPGRLYVSVQEETPHPSSGLRETPDATFPRGGRLGEDGGQAELVPTTEDEGSDRDGVDEGCGGHYVVVTPACIVYRGTEKQCAEYVDRMEQLGGPELRGYLDIEREKKTDFSLCSK